MVCPQRFPRKTTRVVSSTGLMFSDHFDTKAFLFCDGVGMSPGGVSSAAFCCG